MTHLQDEVIAFKLLLCIPADLAANVQPSYMGEQVVLRLRVRRLGGRSITLEVGVYGACANDVRAVIEQTLVSTSLDTHQSIALPSDVVRAVHAGGYVAAG
ncbi:MAG: hypothetical protein NWS83_09905 [Burkholderiaceae bacterium]|nr:hypothetical protein [Burkholderiaceae bacterium]